MLTPISVNNCSILGCISSSLANRIDYEIILFINGTCHRVMQYMHKKTYEIKKENLQKMLQNKAHGPIGLKKKTASNLFRYLPTTIPEKKINIREFDDIIAIDVTNKILEVEGLTSYEKIVSFTLQYGLLPEVSPEL